MVFADFSVIISSRATARSAVTSGADRLERTELYAVCSLFFFVCLFTCLFLYHLVSFTAESEIWSLCIEGEKKIVVMES